MIVKVNEFLDVVRLLLLLGGWLLPKLFAQVLIKKLLVDLWRVM